MAATHELQTLGDFDPLFVHSLAVMHTVPPRLKRPLVDPHPEMKSKGLE